MKPTLAQLERVALRAAWKHEAGEFTPWLAQDENLQRLADALDQPEMQLVATEHPVGDFRLDLLCTDEEGPVIIDRTVGARASRANCPNGSRTPDLAMVS